MGWAMVMIVTIALIILCAVLYAYAKQVKRRLDTAATAALVAQAPLTFTLSDTSVASLAHLSQEPILIKQAEDGLRVLRAARFVATLEMELDPDTERAIAPTLDTFRKVSAERVRDEWVKTMKPGLSLRRRLPGDSVEGVYQVVHC